MYYLSVKIWPCSLWVEIFVNLGIYFLVWPAFCHGNFGKFYLKPYPCYINFWNTKTLLCKLWVKQRVKMNIFSLVARVVPPVTSQLTTVFLIHFIWFTNWSSQTFCKKWVEWIRHELLDYMQSKNISDIFYKLRYFVNCVAFRSFKRNENHEINLI